MCFKWICFKQFQFLFSFELNKSKINLELSQAYSNVHSCKHGGTLCVLTHDSIAIELLARKSTLRAYIYVDVYKQSIYMYICMYE